MNITRWRVGKASLSQRWTEMVGRLMRADQTPWDVEKIFLEWLDLITVHEEPHET